ncbi:MAG TPA: TIGR01777 family oxidoreductase [Ignavibacteriaceae bacterium]|nr:TIGR01777 family oxidoreductase [Ignavibacteriaceae bacterium]
MAKKIIVTGATGLIGKKLCQALFDRGDEIIVFSRNIQSAKKKLPYIKNFVEWNYKNPVEWKNHLDGKDAVVHLAGVNLFSKRWNDNFKKVIVESRELSTRNLVQASKDCNIKPGVFVSASGVGYYGDGGETTLTEDSPGGNDYLADVCNMWEVESRKAGDYGIRNVQIRTGIVLSTEDGALKEMLLPFKLFVGGPLGNGKQWFPWIHISDIVSIYIHAIDNKNIYGPLNAANPSIVRMKVFAKTLGKVMKRPALFPVPEFVLTIVVGEAAGTVVTGQRVSVDKLLNSGYEFEFENLEAAIKNLLN